MHMEETMSQQEQLLQLLKDFGKAWNDHDLDALMSMVTEDCEFHTVAGPGVLGASHKGAQQVRAAFEQAWITFPDAAWLDGEHFVTGDRGVSETTFQGTAADGSRVQARMVDVFTFRDGKIAVKNAFRKQRPVLPAGK